MIETFILFCCSLSILTILNITKVNLLLRLNGVFSSPLNRPAEHKSEISKTDTNKEDVFHKMKELRNANQKRLLLGI